MFNVAIDSKLRGCDLVRLRVGDVHLGDSIRLRTAIVQQKTGRPVPFELTEARAAPTLADICLVPQLGNARRFGVAFTIEWGDCDEEHTGRGYQCASCVRDAQLIVEFSDSRRRFLRAA
jgi:hypothetical protein